MLRKLRVPSSRRSQGFILNIDMGWSGLATTTEPPPK